MADMSMADIKALMGDDDHGITGAGVVVFLIIILLFFWIFSGNQNNEARIRDTFGAELSTVVGQKDNQLATYMTSCETQKEILKSDFNTLLGFKDTDTRLQSCCCDIKSTILSEAQATRDLIQNQLIDRLRTEVADYKNTIANAEQTQFILGAIGNWYANPSVNPYVAYNTCGNNNVAY